MSCSEVMYQAYYPYLYQRPGVSTSSHPVPRTGPFSSPFSTPHHHHQYERFNVQRLPETAHLNQASASSVGLNDHTIYLHAQHQTVNNSNNNNNNNNTLLINNNNNNISTTNSVSSNGCLSPTSPVRIKEDECSLPDRSNTEITNHSVEEDDQDEDMKPSTAQYVSNNCVIFTNYNGDTSSVVDEHFSRALDNKSSVQSKGLSSPMIQRNFPASFWNSQYQTTCNINSPTAISTGQLPQSSSASSSAAATSTAVSSLQSNSHHSDLYTDHYRPHESWYHQYSSHHHRAVHEYHHHHNMTASYSGLLLPSSRLHHHMATHSPCKTVDWQRHPTFEPPYTTYPSMAGLEAQESSKDLYWF